MTPRDTILITGANRGIGLGFVEHLIAQGYKGADCDIIATYREHSSSKALISLAEKYEQLELIQCDVAKEQDIKHLANKLSTRAIDVFINNAGVYGPKGSQFGEVNADEWLNVFSINTVAPLMLCQALYPSFKKAESSKIAFLSSKMGSIADNGYGKSYIYRSSKAALNAVVKSLSIDLKDDNIFCVALHPGWVKTDMGGDDALIEVETSVKGIISVIEDLAPNHTGNFISYDGQEIPW
ncbi:SDR family oxidoreductase [Flocculibacter collagenilyticus]|uniref:SDR family oxidoreductase n=1 Tax=Flocculibacter collagenilyticus TaxID=2744479 RepID=UPI0018F76BBD|nr:SDR family oxidoreductase [Flocculibacter collagenilyticus]